METGELCTRNTVTIRDDKQVKHAVNLMKQYHVGCLVVVKPNTDHPVPIGIVTDRDIILRAMPAGNPAEMDIKEIMSSPVITVAEHTSIFDTLAKMRYNGTRRLPVVNEKGHLSGIIALDDIMEFLLTEMSEISQIFKKEEPMLK